MTVYGFNDKQNAQALDRFASNILGDTNNGTDRIGEDSLIVKVPDGETLGARVGEDVGTLLCEIQQLGTSATLSDSGSTCLVYNKSLTAFEAGEYINVSRQKSLWVVVSGGSGSSIRTMVSSSVITSRSGSTAGVGTAVSYSYDDSSGNYITGTEDPAFNIVNPYAQSVGDGVVIQCHSVGDKWEIIQSECEDV